MVYQSSASYLGDLLFKNRFTAMHSTKNKEHHLTAIDTSSNHEIAAFLKLATRMNWEIESVDDLGVHLRMKKKYGSGYFLVGAVTVLFLVGFLVWLAGFIDYLASSDRTLFIPHADLSSENAFVTADLLF